MLLLLLFPSLLLCSSCPSDLLVVYRLELKTFWDEQTFPKQYPQWRPHAHWSKTIGFSHPATPSSPLFSVGSVVSEGVRQFVETGDADVLDRELGNTTMLDTILAPPVEQGAGNTTTDIFVDSNHTQVSLITKIVPSPDWFIGLDSFELCNQGSFIQSVSSEAFPLDAGTDNGFTFSSPNWATEPRGSVFQMTSQFPSHPAGSFHYPNLDRLPTLAMFKLTKLREYVLQDSTEHHKGTTPNVLSATEKKEHQEQEDSLKSETVKYNFLSTIKPIVFGGGLQKQNEKKGKGPKDMSNQITSNEIPQLEKWTPNIKKSNRLSMNGRKLSKGFRSSSSLQGYHASTSPESFFKKKYESQHLSKAERRISSSSLAKVPKTELFQHIIAQYRNKGIKPKRKKLRRSRKHRNNKKPRNCEVSEWSVWGACSKSCGIGESSRSRSITQHPKHGGQRCPSLRDYKWCGSARNCKKGYFRW